ncbi:hypothetical protein OROGR_026735 [Orobanche gracilis]
MKKSGESEHRMSRQKQKKNKQNAAADPRSPAPHSYDPASPLLRVPPPSVLFRVPSAVITSCILEIAPSPHLPHALLSSPSSCTESLSAWKSGRKRH